MKQIFPSWKSTLGHPNKLKRALKALVLVLSTCIALAVVTAAFLLMAVPVTKICDLNDAQVILFMNTEPAVVASPPPPPRPPPPPASETCCEWMRLSGGQGTDLLGEPLPVTYVTYYQRKDGNYIQQDTLSNYRKDLGRPGNRASYRVHWLAGQRRYRLWPYVYHNFTNWCVGRYPYKERSGNGAFEPEPWACASFDNASVCPGSLTLLPEQGVSPLCRNESSCGDFSLECTAKPEGVSQEEEDAGNRDSVAVTNYCYDFNTGYFQCGAMALSGIIWWLMKMYGMRDDSQQGQLCNCCCARVGNAFDKQLTGAGINFVLAAATALAIGENARYELPAYGGLDVAEVHYVFVNTWIDTAFQIAIFMVFMELLLWAPVYMLLCQRGKNRSADRERCMIRAVTIQFIVVVLFSLLVQALSQDFEFSVPDTPNSEDAQQYAEAFIKDGIPQLITRMLASLSLSAPQWAVPSAPIPMLLTAIIGPCLFGIEQIELILDDCCPIFAFSLEPLGFRLGKKLRTKLGVDEHWDPPDEEDETNETNDSKDKYASATSSASSTDQI